MRSKKTANKKKKTVKKGRRSSPQKAAAEQQQAPAKKRGRPSNAELAERTKAKRQEQDVVREQLLAAIESNVGAMSGSINVSPQTPHDSQHTSPANVTKPKYPVFFMGEDVCMGWWENLYEGYVVDDPDPVNGALVRVKWDDGRISWHAKDNLRSTYKQKQRKVKRTIYGDQQRVARNLEDTSSID
jgi:hypothetical protein